MDPASIEAIVAGLLQLANAVIPAASTEDRAKLQAILDQANAAADKVHQDAQNL